MPKTTTINVADAKRHFADLLGRVAYGGEMITITRRGKPMARLVPINVDAAAPHVADAQGWLEDDDPFLQRSTPLWPTGRPINLARSGRQTTNSMYLLDTNALSELLKKRPKPQFLTRLRRHPPEMFFTSIICVMELRHGSRRREDHAVFWPRITHEVLSRVTIIDFSYTEAVVAGDILAHLARRGELIGVEDLLIGATALVREYTVVTGNVRHFERIPALQVENWLV